MTSKRQLAAIMFTDISGFSAIMQDDESYARTILDRHRSVLEENHKLYDGKILQYIGDGTLSIFNSAVSAVECAVEMQRAFRRHPQVPLRIGIHTGDITYDDNGAFGDGVNVTSRVERLCIPGAVYITDKVYDDIKNHAWLTALPLGRFKLHNIHAGMELYAVDHKELVVPEEQDLIGLPEYTGDDIGVASVRGQKSKWVAGGLAFFFGIFGVHRFYLGQTWRGILYLVAFAISMAATIEGEVPLIAFMAIIAFIDAVLFFAMPWVDFDYKYNTPKAEKKRKKTQRKFQHRRKPLPAPTPPRKRQLSALESRLKTGKMAIKTGQYEQAIQAFDEVLDLNETHNEAHYLLATCFSMLKDEENAFIHLGLAVKHGWKDEARIRDDIHLHYLRSLPTFEGFVQNGYKLVEALPEPKPDLLDSAFDPLVLERIEDLGEKLERGELTREEFEEEKHKILKGG